MKQPTYITQNRSKQYLNICFFSSSNSTLSTMSNNVESHVNNQAHPIIASGSSSSIVTTGAIEKARDVTPGPSNQSNMANSSSTAVSNTIKSASTVTSSISSR